MHLQDTHYAKPTPFQMPNYNYINSTFVSLGRWFWISWANDVIDVGLGPTVGYDAVMQWDASKFEGRHPVNAISILTLTVDGYWEFADYPSE